MLYSFPFDLSFFVVHTMNIDVPGPSTTAAIKDQQDHDALVLPEIPDSHSGIAQKLPAPIRILYGLNGMTEAFPTLALVAMVNDRIEIPISFVPAYFAVSFLPYSLKPLYAIAANVAKNRKRMLLVVLYICSGLSFQVTAFLQRGQIVTCFLVAFLRGVFVSSAEFMIGLGLLSCASASVIALKLATDEMITDHDDSLHRSHRRLHEKLLSCFQSDAATFRNIGSFLSQLLSFALIMAYRLFDHGNELQEEEEEKTENAQHQLSDGLITVFFLLSSLFPFIAAFVVAKSGLFRTCCDNEVLEDDNTCQRKDRDLQHFGIFRLIKYDLIGLVIFQLLLLLIGVRSIIVENTSSRTFVILSFILGISLVTSIILSRSKQVFPSNEYVVTHTFIDGSSNRKRIESMVQQLIYLKKVGLYLVLRHAVPTLDVIVSSYIYTIFRYKPLLLQSMSFLGSGVAAISTWTYNKRFAEKFSSVDGIKRVIMLATTACCVWGMLTIPFIQSFRNLIKDDKFTAGTMLLGTFTLFRLIGGFLNEISFMPSIILATTTVIHEDTVHQNNDDHDEDEDDVFDDELDPDINGLEPPEQSVNYPLTKTIDSGIQYGFLVACIDFGDQMSTFISVPLLTFFGVTRENDWNNLEWFIFTCSILGMLSLIFLRLLPI